jgi:hypothetical protein
MIIPIQYRSSESILNLLGYEYLIIELTRSDGGMYIG